MPYDCRYSGNGYWRKFMTAFETSPMFFFIPTGVFSRQELSSIQSTIFLVKGYSMFTHLHADTATIMDTDSCTNAVAFKRRFSCGVRSKRAWNVDTCRSSIKISRIRARFDWVTRNPAGTMISYRCVTFATSNIRYTSHRSLTTELSGQAYRNTSVLCPCHCDMFEVKQPISANSLLLFAVNTDDEQISDTITALTNKI